MMKVQIKAVLFFGYTNRKNERPHFPLMRKQKRKKARNVLDGVGSAKKPRPKLFEANAALGDNICGVVIPLGRTLTRYITSIVDIIWTTLLLDLGSSVRSGAVVGGGRQTRSVMATWPALRLRASMISWVDL
jgi:hypothetical protein